MVVFSTSPGKRAAVEALGAQFINSKDAADMAFVTGPTLTVTFLSLSFLSSGPTCMAGKLDVRRLTS